KANGPARRIEPARRIAGRPARGLLRYGAVRRARHALRCGGRLLARARRLRAVRTARADLDRVARVVEAAEVEAVARGSAHRRHAPILAGAARQERRRQNAVDLPREAAAGLAGHRADEAGEAV